MQDMTQKNNCKNIKKKYCKTEKTVILFQK